MSGLISDLVEDVRKITSSQEFWDAVATCEEDQGPTASAVTSAFMDWRSRGQRKEGAQRKEQARILREALAILDGYREIIENDLAGRVIHDPATGNQLVLAPGRDPSSPVNAGPVLRTVESVIYQLVDDLENRNSEDLPDHKERNFFYCLGRAFAKAGLKRPPLKTLRRLAEAVGAAGEKDKDKNDEDPDILHTFDSGGMSEHK